MVIHSLLLAFSFASTDQVPSCLDHLIRKRGVEVSAYDVANDKQGGNTISCNFGLTPSEAASDIKAIADAVKAKGCDRLISVANLPLSVQLETGRSEKLSKKGVCREQEKIKQLLCKKKNSLSIDHFELIGWRGAFVGGEEILVNTVSDGSGRPHLKIIALGPI